MRNDDDEEAPPSSRIVVGLSVEEALEIEVELFLFPNNRRLSSPRQPRLSPRQRLGRWCCCPCGCILADEMLFAPPTLLLLGATTSPTTPLEFTQIRIFFLSLKLFRRRFNQGSFFLSSSKKISSITRSSARFLFSFSASSSSSSSSSSQHNSLFLKIFRSFCA
jgi:hypothetical protein